MEIITREKTKATLKRKENYEQQGNKRFIMFYERLTRHMLVTLSKTSSIIIKLDNNHKLNL